MQGNLIPVVLCFGIVLFYIIMLVVRPILNKHYKGRVRRVKIVNKRTTSREMLNFSYTQFNKSNYATFVHQTVDLIYDGKKHIHTFTCYDSVYSKLHKGMVYDVVIRFTTIEKVIKKIK